MVRYMVTKGTIVSYCLTVKDWYFKKGVFNRFRDFFCYWHEGGISEYATDDLTQQPAKKRRPKKQNGRIRVELKCFKWITVAT